MTQKDLGPFVWLLVVGAGWLAQALRKKLSGPPPAKPEAPPIAAAAERLPRTGGKPTQDERTWNERTRDGRARKEQTRDARTREEDAPGEQARADLVRGNWARKSRGWETAPRREDAAPAPDWRLPDTSRQSWRSEQSPFYEAPPEPPKMEAAPLLVSAAPPANLGVADAGTRPAAVAMAAPALAEESASLAAIGGIAGLRDPASLRQAIVLREILGRPVSLR